MPMIDHEPTGEVTVEEIDYARQDGRCTVDALNALKQEFDKHPIGLKPYSAYSDQPVLGPGMAGRAALHR